MADRLANTAHELEIQDMDICVFSSPPPVWRQQLEWDTRGIRFSRMCGS